MAKTPAEKKRLKEINAQLKVLQDKLVVAKRLEGKDDYIDVKVKNKQSRSERIKKKGGADTVLGKFYMQIEVTAKQSAVFIPLSVASGKRTAGFMYQIEGTAEGSVVTAEPRVRGEGVSQVKVGTLLFVKIPVGKTASFEIRTTIRGKSKKEYKIVITRLNYKLSLSETRYQQYLKELHSPRVTLS